MPIPGRPGTPTALRRGRWAARSRAGTSDTLAWRTHPNPTDRQQVINIADRGDATHELNRRPAIGIREATSFQSLSPISIDSGREMQLHGAGDGQPHHAAPDARPQQTPYRGGPKVVVAPVLAGGVDDLGTPRRSPATGWRRRHPSDGSSASASYFSKGADSHSPDRLRTEYRRVGRSNMSRGVALSVRQRRSSCQRSLSDGNSAGCCHGMSGVRGCGSGTRRSTSACIAAIWPTAESFRYAAVH